MQNQNSSEKLPHLLKYMGSKREIISFVSDSINSLGVNSDWLCDLFAGTGIVSASNKDKYNVHANDIQTYSAVLSKTYLTNLKDTITEDSLGIIKGKVESLVQEFKNKYSELVFKYDDIQSLLEFQNIEIEQQELINSEFDIGFHLFSKYYSGTYWSFEQTIWIDSIRAIAEQYIGKSEYYAILSSLIFAMSYVSQSTGHYAQYRVASTEKSMNDILVYRRKNIWSYFERKFKELVLQLNGVYKEYRVTSLDYIDCLRIIEENSIVYADPPYQSVHYSRFYHILETLVKYDYPKVLYKGRYRDDRHQSPFCKKTTVISAFKSMFEGVDSKKSHLVLSYSNTGLISMNQIRELGKDVFPSNYSISSMSIEHNHSNMGRSEEKHQEVTEHIIVFKRC